MFVFWSCLAVVQSFSSSSADVQSLTSEILSKQILLTPDVPTFLFLFTEEGLKSTNNRQKLQSIQLLPDLLDEKHRFENLSPILEILLVQLHESNYHGTAKRVLMRSVDHMRRILGSDVFSSYLESYSSSLRRAYQSSLNEKDTDQRIPVIDTDLEDDDQTPRARVQETTERFHFDHSGSTRFDILFSSFTELNRKCLKERNIFCEQKLKNTIRKATLTNVELSKLDEFLCLTKVYCNR